MNQPVAQAPLRLPDNMARADIGPYMRSLREHYGLSQQDVSTRLHLRAKYIEAIEASSFDFLPGKVYAKGYVHTCAEFLGLHAEQVVDKCLGDEPVRETQGHFIPEPARDSRRRSVKLKKINWRLAGAALFVLFGVYSLLGNASREEAPIEEVAVGTATSEVPEEILVPIRKAVMPNSRNLECLSGRGTLSCFYAARQTRRWIVPAAAPSYAGIAAWYGKPLPAKKSKEKE